MKQLEFLISFLLIIRISMSQCFRGFKNSIMIPSKCIVEDACDGYLRKDSSVCFSYNITVTPQYNVESIKCELAKGEDEFLTVYMCYKCNYLTPFGKSCTGCSNDEYLSYQNIQTTPFCIKKKQFGVFPNINGFLAPDQKSIIPACFPNQIISEQINQIDEGTFSIPTCLDCPYNYPQPNSNRTLCFANCQNDEVLDTRYNIKKCIKKQSCTGFIYGYGSQCASKCDSQSDLHDPSIQASDTIATYYEQNNLKICKVCPKLLPYISNDGLRCLQECNQGYLVNEGSNYCIPIEKCKGFVKETEPKICYQNSCPKGSNGKPDTILKRTQQDTNYCSDCPTDTPFFLNGKCTGCPLIMDLSSRTCIDKLYSDLRNYLVREDNKALYPLSYCPDGYMISQNKCLKCPAATPISLPNRLKCCKSDEPYSENNNCSKCSQGVVFNFTCLTQCPLYYTKSKPNPITQCESCKDEDLFNKNNTNGCLIQCQKGQVYSMIQNKCILVQDCKQTIDKEERFCSNQTCGSFDPLKSEPAIFLQSLPGNPKRCVQCPTNQPFMEMIGGQLSCSNCQDKIKIYQTGMCVKTIDEIFNPQLGVFKNQKKEFWPQNVVQSLNCKSITTFKYGSLILKECSDLPCNPPLVVDQRNLLCIQPQLCSLALSKDGSVCSANCQSDEIQATALIDKSDPNYGTKSNNGNLIQCQNCPQNKPYLDRNTKQCLDSCSNLKDYNMINVSKTMCIQKSECQNFVSLKQDRCVDKCGKSERPRNNQCEYCGDSTPYTYNRVCYPECPENLYFSQDFECLEYYKCKGYILRSSKQCLETCPSDKFKYTNVPQNKSEFFIDSEYDETYKSCEDVCPSNYFHDYQNKKCSPIKECTKIADVNNRQCVDQCPSGKGVGSQDFYITYMNEYRQYVQKIDVTLKICKSCNDFEFSQYGECKGLCQDQKVEDKTTHNCIDGDQCKAILGYDGFSCNNICQEGQAKILSKYYPTIQQCYNCPGDTPFIDYQGDYEICARKCKIYNSEKKNCVKNPSNLYLKKNDDGTFYTVEKCFEIGFISEQTCDQDGKNCYFLCKACPKETPLVVKNSCQKECPPQMLAIPSQQTCITLCPKFNVFDIDSQKCIDIETCSKYAELDNNICTRNCPPSYLILYDLSLNCFLNNDCQPKNFAQKLLKGCSKQKQCPSDLLLIQIKGLTYCLNYIPYSLISNLNPGNLLQFTFLDQKICNGIISSDGRSCNSVCNQNEFPIINKQNQLQCGPCNLFISSDGKMCINDCIFPDINQNGKCVKWKSTDFLNKCQQDQILDTTTLPPYLCISKDQCKQAIVGNRCVKDCNSSNQPCKYASVYAEKDINNFEFILSRSQNNEEITSIQNLNLALMKLDWFANFIGDLFVSKTNSFFTLPDIKFLTDVIMKNRFYAEYNKVYCNNQLLKVSVQSPARGQSKFGQYLLECYGKSTYSKYIDVALEQLAFGFPGRLRVAYQKIVQGQSVKAIDTNEYKSENDLVSFKETSYYLHDFPLNDIFTIFIKDNPFCNNNQCNNYPLFYVDISENIGQVQIKFSLKVNPPRTVCAYYLNSTNVQYKPGCITEDSQFILCPYKNDQYQLKYNYVSLYEDESSQIVQETQSVCSSSQLSPNKINYDSSGTQNIDAKINSGHQDKNDNQNNECYDLATLISIIFFSCFIFFSLIVIGIWIMLKKKYNQNLKFPKNQQQQFHQIMNPSSGPSLNEIPSQQVV